MGLFNKEAEENNDFTGFKAGDYIAYRSTEAQIGAPLQKGIVAKIETYGDDVLIHFMNGEILLEDEISWWVIESAPAMIRPEKPTALEERLMDKQIETTLKEKYGF